MKYEVLKRISVRMAKTVRNLLRLATFAEYGKSDEATRILTSYSINESEGAQKRRTRSSMRMFKKAWS
jgi:hypothetical protein